MNYAAFEKRCKEKGTHPNVVAEKIGLKKGNATNWSKGGNPSVEKLIQLSVELECTTDYLLGLSDDPVDYENSDENLNAPLDVIDYFEGDAEKIYNFQKAVEQDARNEFYDNNGNLLHNVGVDYREESIITKYRRLDAHGAKIVDLVLNEEYERCTQDTIETSKGAYKVARAAAFGGGVTDIPISADVSTDEINRMIDENKALQRRKKNDKIADDFIDGNDKDK